MADNILSEITASLEAVRRRETFDIYEESVLVSGKDGSGLYTKVFRPEKCGNFPVLFQRSCYEEQQPVLDRISMELAARGYAAGYQFCRGVGKSQGKWEPFVHEREDGRMLIKWLTDQPWCGDIGLFGLSYLGFALWMLAEDLPKKVKTMAISHAGSDRYDAMYRNGMFRHDVYTEWARRNAGGKMQGSYPDCCNYKPFISVSKDLWGNDLSWFRDWCIHCRKDDAYWTEGTWGQLYVAPEKIQVPVCLTGGWYDHHLSGILGAYNRLPEKVRENSLLLVGPWNHDLKPCVDAYDLPDAEIAGPQAYAQVLRWMDMQLKGIGKKEKGVMLYEIGGGQWLHYASMPEPERREIYYLTSERQLSRICEPTEQCLTYRYDPAFPLKLTGGESMLYTEERSRGSRLQPEAANEGQMLIFRSGILENSLRLGGKIRVHLTVKTTAEDTAFGIRLLEEKKNGEIFNIRGDIMSISHSNMTNGKQAYRQGEETVLELETWPVFWRFSVGSRLRLEIRSSMFPEYHQHANTIEPWALAEEMKTAEQTVITGAGSRIELPVLEGCEAPASKNK